MAIDYTRRFRGDSPEWEQGRAINDILDELSTHNSTYARRLALRLPPRVMSSPPTVTVTNGTAPATTLAGSVLTLPGQSYTSIVCDDLTKFTPLGAGTAAPVRGVTAGPSLFGCAWTPTVNGPAALRHEFIFDGSAFEACLRQFSGTQFRVMVDGEYVTRYPVTFGGTGNNWGNVKVDFGSRAVRRIVFETNATLWLGIWFGINDSMRAVPQPVKRLLVVGDSITGGSGVSTSVASWALLAGQMLGFSDVVNSGAGSTGWIAAGTSANALNRLATDIVAPAPTDVIFALGHNDSGSTAAAITAQVMAVLNATKAALPALKSLTVVSAFNFGGQLTTINGAIQAGCLAAGVSYIDVATVPIWTGTGNVGTPAGSGQADLYNGDGTHPTDQGAAWLGHAVAMAVGGALNAA